MKYLTTTGTVFTLKTSSTVWPGAANGLLTMFAVCMCTGTFSFLLLFQLFIIWTCNSFFQRYIHALFKRFRFKESFLKIKKVCNMLKICYSKIYLLLYYNCQYNVMKILSMIFSRYFDLCEIGWKFMMTPIRLINAADRWSIVPIWECCMPLTQAGITYLYLYQWVFANFSLDVCILPYCFLKSKLDLKLVETL